MIKDFIKFDLSGYVSKLAAMPLSDQYKAAEELTGRPKDYPAISYEKIFEDNADILEVYYLKYLEKANKCPKQCLDSVTLDFAEKVIDLVERNL